MKLLYKTKNSVMLIMTEGSKNPKTGRMVQTWILDSAMNPIDAYQKGMDHIICGDCPRKSKPAGGNGSCYVNTGFAPNAIWKKYNREREAQNASIPDLNKLYVFGSHQHIRVGAYGDPAMIPFNVWDNYLSQSLSWTGYTHQWKNCDQRLKKYCMASVDNMLEAKEAQAMGWRTFRTYYNDVENTSYYRRQLHEAMCPASKEAGKKVQCIACPNTLKCRGNGNGMTKSYNIVIKEH